MMLGANEPVRVFPYVIDDAPYFVVPVGLFRDSLRASDSMSVGDDVVIYYRKSGVETPYAGRVLSKRDSITRYNSIEIDWGLDDYCEFMSPWEIYSLNTREIHIPPKPEPEFLQKCDAVLLVLQAAQPSFPKIFEQPPFSASIVYPMDFGLIQRRLSNGFYRGILTLLFDIQAAQDSQEILKSGEIENAKRVSERLRRVIENPEAVSQCLDFGPTAVEEVTELIDGSMGLMDVSEVIGSACGDYGFGERLMLRTSGRKGGRRGMEDVENDVEEIEYGDMIGVGEVVWS
jgi:hypothetical protein